MWLRAVNESESIPIAVLRVLGAPKETFGVAAISLWEVGKKVQSGKLVSPAAPEWFAHALAANIEVLPVSASVVTNAMRLPEFPNRDPADELIVATARVHRLTLITTDTRLKNYCHVAIHYFKPIHRRTAD